jgi:Protein of unknown function (DUF3168)
MTSPLVSLKDAMRQWLLADVELLALLRAAKIFLEPPKHTAFPYVAFLTSRASENGTSSDEGHIIEFSLGIWSRHKGSAESLSIASAIDRRLSTMPGSLDGHHLVNLIVRSVEPLRLRDDESWLTQIRIRAITEVI